MKPEIKSFFSPDIPFDELSDWVPSDPRNFGLLVEAFIGPEGTDAQDLFSFQVCTPAWLSNRLAELDGEPPYIIGHHYIIVDSWDYDVLRRAFTEFCFRSEGSDWKSATRKVSRFGAWEFQETEYDD